MRLKCDLCYGGVDMVGSHSIKHFEARGENLSGGKICIDDVYA